MVVLLDIITSYSDSDPTEFLLMAVLPLNLAVFILSWIFVRMKIFNQMKVAILEYRKAVSRLEIDLIRTIS